MGLLDYVRDVAQGASNAVSSNVSGPVDLISWGLRKAGLPIPDAPMGGSQWMRNAGLLQDPKSQSAGLAGETLGLLAGPLAAAKAPQIAAGLLQGGANLAAPRTLNPQTGAIVWHGSPHKFDKFDSSKIGTGEGVQAYGHGLYLAESPDVAHGYKTTLSPYELVKDGKQIPYEQMDAVAAGVASDIASKKGDVKAVRSMYENMANQKFGGAVAKQRLAALDSMGANVGAEKGGSLYKVDLPDEHIAKMLDWDKPLSQQAPDVQKALSSPQVSKMVNDLKASGQLGGYSPAEMQRLTGSDWHDMIRQANANSNIAPSDFLRQQGIPGIRYLDGGSRGTGQGTSNFVVFPGNEGLLQILERNGQALK